jgi:hypothetical protein
MSETYAKLDALILEAITSGRRFGQSLGHEVSCESTRLAGIYCREPYRIVDQRLQYLRKKGKIYYIAGQQQAASLKLWRGWHINHPTPESK